MSTVIPASQVTAASPEEQHIALRKNILIADYSHYGIADVSGSDSFDFLNSVVSGDLSTVRQEQVLYTLMLDSDGRILTDLYVLCDDERFIVMSEWLSGEQLRTTMLQHVGQYDVEIAPRDAETATLLFEGPYSWELMAEMFGIDVLGLPFLEFMRVDGGILLRAGKHGEFSFKVLVDRGKATQLWTKAVAAGQKYDLKIATRQFQHRARLENPCWNPTSVGEFTRCPIELQLQWMVRYDKEQFVGRDALLARFDEGVKARSVGFVVEGAPNIDVLPGNPVLHEDQVIGKVMAVGYSPERGCHVGQALLDSEFAYADVDRYEIRNSAGDRIAIKTSCVPFIRNFSFLINPAEHSYVKPGRAKSYLDRAR